MKLNLNEAFLEQAGIDFLHGRSILVSISEAFTNALIHGNCKNPEKSINIVIRMDSTSIEVEVTDEGHGAIEAINSRKSVNEFSESGRGINVIEHYANVLKLSETESGGLKVFMSFGRSKLGKIQSQL